MPNTTNGKATRIRGGQSKIKRADQAQRKDTSPNESRRLSVTYDYASRDGERKAQKVRTEPKGFYWRYWTSSENWARARSMPFEVQLYRQRELLKGVKAGKPVYVVDGEKDVDTMVAHGLVATCCPHGSERWRDEDSAHFLGATKVVVIQDDDSNHPRPEHRWHGHDGAVKTKASIARIVGADRVQIMAPVVGCKDITEHFEAGRDLSGLTPSRFPSTPRPTTEAGYGDSTHGETTAKPKPRRVIKPRPKAKSFDKRKPELNNESGQTAKVEMDWPTIDKAAFYGLPGEVVRTLDPHTEADPAALLANFLVAFGSAVGPGPFVYVNRYKHQARLFLVVVGETAFGRKGTARGDIMTIFRDAAPVWFHTRVMGGLASGEGLITVLADENQKSDKKISKHVDRRFMLTEEEFARVLVVASRKDSTVSTILRQAYDSNTLRVIRANNPLVANNVFVSVSADITPSELRQRITEVDVSSGFLNRFVFACVKRSKMLPEGGSLSDEELAFLVSRTEDAMKSARKVKQVQRSQAAKEMWREMYEEQWNTNPDETLGMVLHRFAANCLRLSLTYALTDGSDVIEVEHLEAAYAFWRYCAESAAYVFGGLSGDPIADQIITALVGAENRRLTKRDVLQKVFHGHVLAERIDTAVALLVRRGLVKVGKEPTKGRPREWVALAE